MEYLFMMMLVFGVVILFASSSVGSGLAHDAHHHSMRDFSYEHPILSKICMACRLLDGTALILLSLVLLLLSIQLFR